MRPRTITNVSGMLVIHQSHPQRLNYVLGNRSGLGDCIGPEEHYQPEQDSNAWLDVVLTIKNTQKARGAGGDKRRNG